MRGYRKEQAVLTLTKKTMLAAAVATGVAATGVTYFTEPVAPAAQSASMAPVVTSKPSPGAFATPNRLLQAMAGTAVSPTDIAPQRDTAAAAWPVSPAAVPEAQSRPALVHRALPVQVGENYAPVTAFLHPTAALVGDGPAPHATPAGAAVNPVGILGAAVAVFVSNGDEPGENGGLLIGNGADGGPGQDGGRGGLLMGKGGEGVAGVNDGRGANGGDAGLSATVARVDRAQVSVPATGAQQRAAMAETVAPVASSWATEEPVDRAAAGSVRQAAPQPVETAEPAVRVADS
jgi:hypothetical protein